MMVDSKNLGICRFAEVLLKETAFSQTSALLVGRWFQPTPSSRIEF